MGKYKTIAWLVLCLGFAGNVTWGQGVNEGENLASDNNATQLTDPNKVNIGTSEALSLLVQAARSDLSSFSDLARGQDGRNTVFLANAFLGQPLENQTIESAFDLKKEYYDECPQVQFALSHLYEFALAAYFMTGEHYWFFLPLIVAEWYSKGLINTLAMNAIASHMSNAWVPGNNSWVDAAAKTAFYRLGINYMKDSNLSTLVSQGISDGFAYASSFLDTGESNTE